MASARPVRNVLFNVSPPSLPPRASGVAATRAGARPGPDTESGADTEEQGEAGDGFFRDGFLFREGFPVGGAGRGGRGGGGIGGGVAEVEGGGGEGGGGGEDPRDAGGGEESRGEWLVLF